MKPGDIVEATFTPQHIDDLNPAAQAIVGQQFRWTCTREVEGNGPAYDGQWRLELGRDDVERTGIWWVALCDLSNAVHVGIDERAADEYAITRRNTPQIGHDQRHDTTSSDSLAAKMP